MDTPVTFSLPELWMLNDFIRHEVAQQEQWKYPPADLELNDEIAASIQVCTVHNLPEYTLFLTRHQLLIIDFCIRADFKNPEKTASGKTILLKSFAARESMDDPQYLHPPTLKVLDITYKEAMERAGTNPSQDTDNDPYSNTLP